MLRSLSDAEIGVWGRTSDFFSSNEVSYFSALRLDATLGCCTSSLSDFSDGLGPPLVGSSLQAKSSERFGIKGLSGFI